jgi:lipopolysaccharide exporter
MASFVTLMGKHQLHATKVLSYASALFCRFKNAVFVRNVLVVMTGSIIGQAIGFVLSPLISRLYTPADFGLYGSFGAITGVVAAITTLDYSQAIMLPKQREKAAQVFLISCVATMAVTVVFSAMCLLLADTFTGLLKTGKSWTLLLLVLAVFVGGINASFQAWCVRIKGFKHTSASQALRGFSSNGLQVGFGFTHSGAPGLIISSLLGDCAACVNLLPVIYKDLNGCLANIQWRRLKQIATEYHDFPAFSATQNLLNALSNSLPVLLLTHFYGIAVAGAYAFGMRLINAPMSLLIGSLRQVLFQRAGEMQHQGLKLSPLFIKATVGLFGICILPAMVMATYSPQIFAYIFGAEWRMAGELARYLVLWLLFGFCNLPAVLFARLIRIQRTLFLYNAIVLIARILVLVIGGLYMTALYSIALFSMVGAVMNLALIFLVWRVLIGQESKIAV